MNTFSRLLTRQNSFSWSIFFGELHELPSEPFQKWVRMSAEKSMVCALCQLRWMHLGGSRSFRFKRSFCFSRRFTNVKQLPCRKCLSFICTIRIVRLISHSLQGRLKVKAYYWFNVNCQLTNATWGNNISRGRPHNALFLQNGCKLYGLQNIGFVYHWYHFNSPQIGKG